MELYTEKLIKKKMDNKDLTIKSLIIAITGCLIYFLVGFVLAYSVALTFFIASLIIYGAWYLFKYTNIEYEYSDYLYIKNKV